MTSIIKILAEKFFPCHDCNVQLIKSPKLDKGSYVLCSISYNNMKIFDLHIFVDHIDIQWIFRSTSSTKTSFLLVKSIHFAKTLRLYNTFTKISSICIPGQMASLYFTTHKLLNNEVNKYIRIRLFSLHLLAYGQTWYNKLGFGSQLEEWKYFISQPCLSFLEKINCPLGKDSVFTHYEEDDTISDVFSNIISSLKECSYQDGHFLNMLRDEDTHCLQHVKEVSSVINYIFSMEDCAYKYIPKINTQNCHYY